ncbi:hypothetical protein P3T76_009040 [Phytophthora citrophthora]|uniref:Uncharacterized protein n=1 Tax=Phytophthora citrophthora TaxID=4793 RepID=A0AAD9GI26_9STRA|nr:hypothetical protein P3T76_009040 [Phytophthora citrophthora]
MFYRLELLGVVMDCPINWRSTMAMLNRLIEFEWFNAFIKYLFSRAGEKEFSDLTRTNFQRLRPLQEEWHTIRNLVELLAQFDALTDEMRELKQPSLVLALPGICALETTLQDRHFLWSIRLCSKRRTLELDTIRDMLFIADNDVV